MSFLYGHINNISGFQVIRPTLFSLSPNNSFVLCSCVFYIWHSISVSFTISCNCIVISVRNLGFSHSATHANVCICIECWKGPKCVLGQRLVQVADTSKLEEVFHSVAKPHLQRPCTHAVKSLPLQVKQVAMGQG